MAVVSTGRRGKWWLYAVPWLPYLTMYLTAFVANGLPLGFAMRGAVANVLPDALLGLVILRVPRHLRWPVGKRGRFFATHTALLVAFIVASSIGWAALLLLDGFVFSDARTARLDLRPVPWRVLNDLLIYVALTGVGYAWQNAADSRELAARAARADALRARAQLEAMRSQLNPHFILNTFHALVGLVRRDPAVAEEALEQLGDLLRYSLRIQRESLDEVTLRDEWQLVQSYLDLERLRLGDRLRVSFDAGDDAQDCLVPSFALQTLVENSIRHAIAPRAAGGRLAISVKHVDGRLHIRVEDDGPGEAAPPGEGHGVGLQLLGDRLAALYEGRARLDVTVGAEGGVAVLDLPARHFAEDA